MAGRPIRGILISTDAALRETINGYARAAAGGLAVVLDLAVPLSDFGGSQFKTVQQNAPALVLLDLESAPDLGIQLAKDLAASSQQLVVVAIGHAISSELLIQAIRAGVAEYLTKPVSAIALSEAVERLRPRLAPLSGEDGGAGRTLALFSAKGGAGSSTAATNLAIEIHRLTGKKTLLVDLDAELGEVSLLLGVQPQFNFVDLVENFHRMDANLLTSYIEQHSSGVHLLSAPFHPDRAAAITDYQVRQILLYLRGLYDYILVDTSKSFSRETMAAFEQADDVFLIATVDLPNLRNIQRALPLLRRVMPRGDDQVHLVINRYNPSDEITLKDVERTLGLKVYATLANDYEALIKSVNGGKPLVLNPGKSAYGRDVKSLAAKVIGADAESRDGPGLLGRITAAWRVQKAEGTDKGGKRG